MADGGVRNGYTVRLLNKQPNDRAVKLSVSGAPGLKLKIMDDTTEGQATVGPDQTLELRVLVIAPPDAIPANAAPVTFTAEDVTGPAKVSASDHFFPK
jgi:polyferredoxin